MRYFIGFALVALLSACHSEEKKEIEKDANGNEQFAAFYAKFLTDTTFQLSRIDFPLEGLTSMSDANPGQRRYWEKSNWKYHAPPDEKQKPGLQQELLPLGEDMILDRMLFANAFFIERRFLRTNGEWRLIYYSDLQNSAPGKPAVEEVPQDSVEGVELKIGR